MSKIHPDENKCRELSTKDMVKEIRPPCPSLLTVWKRSSMSFQGTDGFTVYDQFGRLAFRVDNYTRKNQFVRGGGLVLMDGAGKALLTLKPQIFSMQYQWNAYGEENGCEQGTPKTRVFSMRRPSVLHSRGDEAEVFMGGVPATSQSVHGADFSIKGSFRMRNCKIMGTLTGKLVAKIARKKVNNTTILLSDDVFSLVIEPGFDSDLVMAFVIVLDRICGKPFVPALCS